MALLRGEIPQWAMSGHIGFGDGDGFGYGDPLSGGIVRYGDGGARSDPIDVTPIDPVVIVARRAVSS